MGEARDGGRAFCLRRVALLATNSGYLPKASGGAAVGDDSGINVVNREIATGPPNVMSELSALERASNLRRSPPPTRIMRFGRDASVTSTEGMAAAKVPPKKRRASLVPVLERLDRLAPSREAQGRTQLGASQERNARKRRLAVRSPPVRINRGLPAAGGAEALVWRLGGSTVVPKRPLYFAPLSANYSIATLWCDAPRRRSRRRSVVPHSSGLAGRAVPTRETRESGFGIARHALR